jgi:hypothetical protein
MLSPRTTCLLKLDVTIFGLIPFGSAPFLCRSRYTGYALNGLRETLGGSVQDCLKRIIVYEAKWDGLYVS